MRRPPLVRERAAAANPASTAATSYRFVRSRWVIRDRVRIRCDVAEARLGALHRAPEPLEVVFALAAN
ncbi:hypothetical protein HK405_013292 [Cladochytrium tenue]|nr:hypothetical protein HK405_013292 [Cladochytrium tenue]